MSLPPELRVICFQLSSTPAADLPRLTPTLLSYVLRCQAPLSIPCGNASKTESSATAVLVHKLKTQLSTLLNGKSPEGRFTAVVLIKAVVEVGGLEVLQSSESWVRGLLAILGKPDSAATKELCIIALTMIYCMVHPYQSLSREIATPTLPTFVTSCLNLISSKLSSKTLDGTPSLKEAIFWSFSALVPLYSPIYRPFAAQIRQVTKSCLAPTLTDGVFVPTLVKESARRLFIALHNSAAKNSGGEEWGKSIRDLVKDIHVNADKVFRVVVEDWESTSGYVGEAIDVSQELTGGARTAEDLPRWTGIDAGVERIIGLLELLQVYFKSETSTIVSIPLESILDMVNRMLSITLPSRKSSDLEYGGVRENPAIDRNEKDCLWSLLPRIYAATLQMVGTMADRLQEGFIPLAQGSLDQVIWVFASGKHYSEFRIAAYQIVAKDLLHIGQSLDRSQVGKLSPIIISCCRDLQPVDPNSINPSSDTHVIDGKAPRSQKHGPRPYQNSDTLLQSATSLPKRLSLRNTDLTAAAAKLVPLFISQISQNHLELSLRSLIERTAVLNHDESTILATILNSFTGRQGKTMTSLLPHLTREFGNDDIVETLLRPRMPLLPSSGIRLSTADSAEEKPEYETMEFSSEAILEQKQMETVDTRQEGKSDKPGLGTVTDTAVSHGSVMDLMSNSVWFNSSEDQEMTTSSSNEVGGTLGHSIQPGRDAVNHPQALEQRVDATMSEEPENSDDDSVHLTMQLDTESESE